MGFLDDAKAKLAEAVDSHGDTIAAGIDRAGDLIDEKTGGKYAEHIESGKDRAADALDSLDGKDDDIR